MRIVVALGGNALLRRGVPLTMLNQQDSIASAVHGLVALIREHEVVLSHGNGPQVGLLALQAAAYDESGSYPFDVLGAETEGMIGYLLEKELRNQLLDERPVATLMTMTEVDPQDPAFSHPSKFVGPAYREGQAHDLAARHGWTVKRDGACWRRVVPSPLPRRIVELLPVEWLLERGALVICAGGGGVPIARDPGSGQLVGVDAVIDKDQTSAVLALGLRAEALLIVTDVPGVFHHWGTPEQKLIATAHPDALDATTFPAGSMAPKVAAAAAFARSSGGEAVIGDLGGIDRLLQPYSGTHVSLRFTGVTYR